MRLPVCLSVLLLSALLVACSSPIAPEAEAPGLFDEAAYLPTLAAAQASDWQFLQPSGMRCRDGSRTGFGLRRRAGSPNLLILLQGGGACYDLLSCLSNPNRFGRADFDAFVVEDGQAGVFDAGNAANPFRDWNVIFVPYCTGDVHSGDAPNTAVPGLLFRQDFVGYGNMEAMLGRIAGEAQRARHVVLAGVSAGGFGTIGTYGLVTDRLAPAPIDLLDDSGPVPAQNNVLDPGLQQTWRTLWNLNAALPPGCADCAQPNGDGLENVLPYYAEQYPQRSFGLLSYTEDAVIRSFFGLGDPDCATNPLACFVGAEAFEDGLYGIRDALPPANSGTYFAPGDAHTFLLSEGFYASSVEGTSLADWTAAFVAGAPSDVPARRPNALALAE